MLDTIVVGRRVDWSPPSLIVMTLKLDQDKDNWVGECLELGTAAYASSISELREELADAILLQLNEVERLGFIDEYLQERQVKVMVWSKALPSGASEASDPWDLVGAAV